MTLDISSIHKKRKTHILKELCPMLESSFRFTNADAIYFVNLVYKLTEEDSKKYDSLKLYRNWISHSMLSNKQDMVIKSHKYVSEKVLKMQEDLGIGPHEYAGGIYDKYYFWGEITCSIMSFQGLRFDIQDILKEYLGAKEPDSPWWLSCMSGLAKVLLHTPIIFKIEGCPITQTCITYASNTPQDKLEALLESPGRDRLYLTYNTTYDDGEVSMSSIGFLR